jgi:hypothetical protein
MFARKRVKLLRPFMAPFTRTGKRLKEVFLFQMSAGSMLPASDRMSDRDVNYIASNGRMILLMMNYFKGSSRGVIYVLFKIYPNGLRKTMKDRIASGPAEIRSGHLPNTSLERHYKTNLHSMIIILAAVDVFYFRYMKPDFFMCQFYAQCVFTKV